MAAFSINEGTFQLPDGWEDSSVTAISFPAGSPIPAASITVTRETMKDTSETLTSYVNAQVAKLAKSCSAFQLIQHTPTQLSGLPAEMVEFTWNTPEKIAVRQLMVIFFWKTQWLVITSTTQAERFTEFQPVFRGILNSFRTRTN